MENADATSAPTTTASQPKSDLPNFATWTHETLAAWCIVAYTVMQRQEEAVMAMQRELKNCHTQLADTHQLDDDWK